MSRGKKNISSSHAKALRSNSLARVTAIKTTGKTSERLADYLKGIAMFDMKPRNGYSYASFENLIYDKGTVFLSARAGDNLGEMGQCFANAGRLAQDNPDLEYCEGYALAPKCPIPVLHAWCIDKNKEVIDPTWADAKSCAYTGIIIPAASLRKTLLSRQKWGVLDNLEERFPYLKDGIVGLDITINRDDDNLIIISDSSDDNSING